jgi:serine/threonine-protein kinase SRPK3
MWIDSNLLCSTAGSSRKYVTVKISINTLTNEYFTGRRAISEKMATANPKHPGYPHVRFSFDSFKIKGPRHGLERHPEHLCVVYDVLREPIDKCMESFAKRRFNGRRLRLLLPGLLQGLDYLHTECGVVHTDLKGDNIMLGLGGQKVLEDFVQYQADHPLPRKMPDHHGRVIYKSSSKFGDGTVSDEVIKSAKITDIGLAEWGAEENNKSIQSNAFTCPEVILTAGWTYPADIWNLGVMIWDLVEEEGLFDCIPTEPGRYQSGTHLGVMIGLLGPPPTELLERGSTTATYFNDQGEFRKPELIKKHITFENSVRNLKGEEKDLFIDFAKKMICWLPEERWTAKQLLDHPFLTKTEFAMPDPAHDEKESRDLIEQFAVSRPRSMTVTPQPESSPSPPNGSPPVRTPSRTPEPSIKSLSISGRTNTSSTIGSINGLGVQPLTRTTSNLSTSSGNYDSGGVIAGILNRPAKQKSGTTTPCIEEETPDCDSHQLR